MSKAVVSAMAAALQDHPAPACAAFVKHAVTALTPRSGSDDDGLQRLFADAVRTCCTLLSLVPMLVMNPPFPPTAH